MRRKITLSAMVAAIGTAIGSGVGDIAGKSFICSSSACVKIHSSSFGTIFAIPVGLYGAGLLIPALWLYWKRKTDAAAMMLCSLLGVEAYLTFIQAFFIQSFCMTCLVFLALLIVCAFASRPTRFATLIGAMMFFVAHFCFFFPQIDLKPSLMRDTAEINAQVEIFASPSCSHCEQAISVLRGVCEKANTPLIVRPVSISKADTKKSVEWISGKLFSCESVTSYRLAEKIVWSNESEAKQLNNGNLAVPLILVRREGEKELFKGWDDRIQKAICGFLQIDQGIAAVESNILTHRICTITSCEK